MNCIIGLNSGWGGLLLVLSWCRLGKDSFEVPMFGKLAKYGIFTSPIGVRDRERSLTHCEIKLRRSQAIGVGFKSTEGCFVIILFIKSDTLSWEPPIGCKGVTTGAIAISPSRWEKSPTRESSFCWGAFWAMICDYIYITACAWDCYSVWKAGRTGTFGKGIVSGISTEIGTSFNTFSGLTWVFTTFGYSTCLIGYLLESSYCAGFSAISSFLKYFCAWERICIPVRVPTCAFIFFQSLPYIWCASSNKRCSSAVQRPEGFFCVSCLFKLLATRSLRRLYFTYSIN